MEVEGRDLGQVLCAWVPSRPDGCPTDSGNANESRFMMLQLLHLKVQLHGVEDKIAQSLVGLFIKWIGDFASMLIL